MKPKTDAEWMALYARQHRRHNIVVAILLTIAAALAAASLMIG